MTDIWKNRLSKYIENSYKEEVLELYRKCYDYSPYVELDEIVAFVTK